MVKYPPPSRSRRVGNRPAPPWNVAMQLKELRVVQRAGAMITELGVELDRQLAIEARPAERLRLLRETTNRITRIANDAVYAYARASRAVTVEQGRQNGNLAAANEMRGLLDAARVDILDVLAVARRRYPWAGIDDH